MNPYRIYRGSVVNGGKGYRYFIQPLLVIAGILAAIGLMLAIAVAAPVILAMNLIPRRAGASG